MRRTPSELSMNRPSGGIDLPRGARPEEPDRPWRGGAYPPAGPRMPPRRPPACGGRVPGGDGCSVTDDPRPTVLALPALNIGDLLVAVPALRALRRAHPDHRLVLATTAALAPLVDRVEVVDHLLPTAHPTAVPWTGPAPDVAVNLHGTGPQSHRVAL